MNELTAISRSGISPPKYPNNPVRALSQGIKSLREDYNRLPIHKIVQERLQKKMHGRPDYVREAQQYFYEQQKNPAYAELIHAFRSYDLSALHISPQPQPTADQLLSYLMNTKSLTPVYEQLESQFKQKPRTQENNAQYSKAHAFLLDVKLFRDQHQAQLVSSFIDQQISTQKIDTLSTQKRSESLTYNVREHRVGTNVLNFFIPKEVDYDRTAYVESAIVDNWSKIIPPNSTPKVVQILLVNSSASKNRFTTRVHMDQQNPTILIDLSSNLHRSCATASLLGALGAEGGDPKSPEITGAYSSHLVELIYKDSTKQNETALQKPGLYPLVKN